MTKSILIKRIDNKQFNLSFNNTIIILKYVKNEYIYSRASVPVRIDGSFEAELISKAKKVLALQRKGVNLIFPDVLKIEKELLGR